MTTTPRNSPRALGLGIGWRPEIALFIERFEGLGFVEVVAESIDPTHPPEALLRLHGRGVQVIPHGISLSLGGADMPDGRRLAHLARLAERFDSPFVTEHVAFVRAGGVEAGHLLPVPRTHEMLDVLAENVAFAQRHLPVPLGLENIAALVEWPDAELTETGFLAGLLARTGALLLLDAANVHAAACNFGLEPREFIAGLPMDRLAYMHVGGGEERDGIYHDTHAHAVAPEVFALVEEVSAHADIPGYMIERDDHFPPEGELAGELGSLRAAVAAGTARRRARAHAH